jgi:copper(I)-binding protein
VIRSGWGSALPHRLVLVAVAALIPVLAGCEAGNNAPTLEFHPPTETGSVAVGDLAVRNAFVLGAPLGSTVAKGKSASLFLSLTNTGATDRLLSISAPGTAASVTLPKSGILLAAGPPVLLSGPKPVLVLNDLTNTLASGTNIVLKLHFAKAGVITLSVPVMARAAHYQTYAPPQPSPTIATTAAKHHKAHVSASTSPSPSVSPTPSPSAS